MSMDLTDQDVANCVNLALTRDTSYYERLIPQLAREVQAHRRMVAELLALHVSDGAHNPWCDQDGFAYPCPTVRIIAGGES